MSDTSRASVVIDFGQLNLIRIQLKKLDAYADILCEGDLSDVKPSSINIIADHAALAVMQIGEILDQAAATAKGEP